MLAERPGNRRAQLGLLAVVGVALVAALVGLSSHYTPFFADDAFISLRYAERLAAGEGLTWSEGEPAEGYSDLLWVLLLAGAVSTGLDGVATARVLGTVGAAVAVLVLCLPVRGGVERALPRAVFGASLLALAPPLAIWAIGGLEQGFMTGVLAAALWCTLRALDTEGAERWSLAAGGLFAALALLRIDGALWGLVSAGAVFVGAGARGRQVALRLATPVVLVVAGQEAFRLAYHGDWVPNTARAKLAFGPRRLREGALYVARGYLSVGVLVGMALVATGALVRWRGEARGTVTVVLCWSLVLAWTAYLVATGGDFFPGWRQLLLVFVPLAWLVAEGAEQYVARAGGRAWGLLVVVAPLLAGHGLLQIGHRENRRAKQERWEWAARPMSQVLRGAFAESDPLIAVDAAGALPYFTRFRAIDMLGLNDAYLGRNPPPSFGTGPMGHELGDGRYVWDREPDLVAFSLPGGTRAPRFRSGRQLVRQPGFAERYLPVRLAGGANLVGTYYVRVDGVLGVSERSGTRVVPAYLFSGASKRAAAPAEDGVLELALTAGQGGRLRALPLAAGQWRVQARPSHDGLEIAPDCRRLVGGDPLVIEVVEPVTRELAVGLTGGEPLRLRALELHPDQGSDAGWRCGPRGGSEDSDD